MQYSLENEILKISADTFGGEMHSLVSKKSGCDYLWSGNAEYWGFHAPILFPIVGRVNDGKYTVDGNTYQLPTHGFSRTEEHKMVEKRENYIMFELTSNEELLKVYPYKFKLNIRYTLDNSTVHVDYIVANTDSKDMYFSIGAHTGLACPFNKGEEFTDCYLELEQKETASVLPTNDKVQFVDSPVPYLHDENVIKLSYDLFKKDALVFKGLNSQSVCLKSSKSKNYVKFDYAGFPYIAFWTKLPNSPFICLEPWYGIGDFEGFAGDIKEKTGIMCIAPGKSFECRHSITVVE